jgi:predicted Zn-ribbon and HTH transcriptional regulator
MTSKRREDRSAPEPPPAADTLRERLAALLRADEWPADALATQLDIDRATLEHELGHLERSARHRGERIAIAPPCCLGCGATTKPRDARPFHAPRRCPACKQERMGWPRYRLLAK